MSYALIVHGGAGSGSREIFDLLEKEYGVKDLENRYKKSIEECLNLGKHSLKNGGTSLDAVEQCVRYLEDNELFNAGVGSVYDDHNEITHDACITEGRTKKFGAVTNSVNIKNPISLARVLMNRASSFIGDNRTLLEIADEEKLETVDNSYFRSEFREKLSQAYKDLGTVGAVAIDMYGDICSGTSTGGLQGKTRGRIADSSCIGVSTLADNDYVGISTTGNGEEIFKNQVASQVLFRMRFNSETIKDAIDNTIAQVTKSCGVIGVSKNYDVYYSHNTPRMYVGYITPDSTYINLFKN